MDYDSGTHTCLLIHLHVVAPQSLEASSTYEVYEVVTDNCIMHYGTGNTTKPQSTGAALYEDAAPQQPTVPINTYEEIELTAVGPSHSIGPSHSDEVVLSGNAAYGVVQR